jgi:hypothetical protein
LAKPTALTKPITKAIVVFLLNQKQQQAFACSAELCFCLSKTMQSGAEHAKTTA